MITRFLGTVVLLALLSAPAIHAQNEPGADGHPAASLAFRGIGPAYPSGRISQIAIHPDSKAHWYVATSSGGLWETRNAGTTWKPLFDEQPVYALGAIAMDPSDPLTLWVGSGENKAQRSVMSGDGVYVSTDGGQHWRNVGLENSGHIGRIYIDPDDSNTVLVAAQGPLWSNGGDRGLYKTTDAGATWTPILQVDEYTGVNEFVVHPQNPMLIVASSYQRRRHVWTMINGGPGSGLYRSIDGGDTWDEMATGLPTDVMGRIGLAVAPSRPNRLYAIIESDKDSIGIYISEDFGQNWQKQSDAAPTAPFYYNEIFVDPNDADRVYMMDTYTSVSGDAGKTFSKLGNSKGARHVDDHDLWIDPDDSEHLIIGGDGGIYESWDHGKTWRHIENLPIVQFYRVQPDNDWPFYSVCGGTQDNNSMCGPSRTTTIHGITNSDWWTILYGDGYEPKSDPEDPNIIYTQHQYGGLVRYDRRSQERVFIRPMPPEGENPYKFNWNTPLLISPHNNERLYYAAEKVFRSDDRGDSWTVVSPDLTRQLDRNALPVMDRVWSDNAIGKNDSTSMFGSVIGLHESPIQEGLIYVGTDDGLLHVTNDGGANWRKVESVRGVPEMSLIEDVHASSHNVNVAYAVVDNHKRGDNMPYVLKTSDQGRSWQLIAGDLPDATVHTITEDPVDPELLFVGSERGVYFTTNGGENWQKLGVGIPTISVRDIEIQSREHDLVVGTFGRGIYILDDFSPLRVPEGLLADVAATIFPIRDALQYIPGDKWGVARNSHRGDDWWQAENPPFGALITFHLRDGYKTLATKRRNAEIEMEKAGEDTPYPPWDDLRKEDRERAPTVELTILDANGDVVRRLAVPETKGVHRVAWDLRYRHPDPVGHEEEIQDGPPRGLLALPGSYTAALHARIDGALMPIAEPVDFKVELLPLSPEHSAEPAELLAFQQKIARLIAAVNASSKTLAAMQKLLSDLDEALRDTPSADDQLRGKVRELQRRRDQLLVGLEGDRTVSSRNEATAMSISQRASYLEKSSWPSRSAPGGQQREQYAIAERQFSNFIRRLESLKVDITGLEERATELGAPWSPGRMPSW